MLLFERTMSIERKLTMIERRLGTLTWLASVNLVAGLGVLWLVILLP